MSIAQIANEYGMLFMGFFVFAGLIYLIARMFKEAEKKKTNIGKILNDHFLNEHETWIMLTVFGLWLTESLIAASIHPVSAGIEQPQINSVARFFSHFITAIVGIVMVTFMPKVTVSFVESFSTLKGISEKPSRLIIAIPYILAYFALFVLVGYATIRIPLFNIELIAGGLGNLNELNYAWWELFGKTIDYKRLGLPADYNPIRAMTYQMFASWIILLCHYLISLIDAGLVLVRILKKKLDTSGNVNEKINDRAKTRTPLNEDLDDILDDPLKVLKFLIRRVTTHDTAKVDELAEEYKEIFLLLNHVEESKKEITRNKIASSLAQVYTEWKNYTTITAGMTTERKDQHTTVLKNKTLDIFAKPQSGFNRPLVSRPS